MVGQVHDNKNKSPRHLLAPRIWPGGEEDNLAGGAPLYYLSWPGWELYLKRRLGMSGSGAQPILLNGLNDAEQDFKIIDQLVAQAKDLGTGLVPLLAKEPESYTALAGSLRNYPVNKPEMPRPHLDDHSFLALWSVAEFQAWEAEGLLDKSFAAEQTMWEDLKGELSELEDEAQSEEIFTLNLPPRTTADPSRRGTRLAWKCWRRLAAPILNADDVLITTVSDEA